MTDPTKITPEDIKINQAYTEWIKKQVALYGRDMIAGRGELDEFSKLAIELREGKDYDTGEPLTDLEKLQHWSTIASLIAVVGIAGYYGTHPLTLQQVPTSKSQKITGTKNGKEYSLNKDTDTGTGSYKKINGAKPNSIEGFISGTKNFNEVLDEFAKAYAGKVNSNSNWKWRDIPGSEKLNDIQIAEIRETAKIKGYIPAVPMKPDTKFPDFKKADVIYKINGFPVIKELPKELWMKGDKVQFEWLDKQLPNGRPAGYIWHHSEIPGKMELVEFGIHNSTWHKGGRAPGEWADAKR
ncbi:HNH endonuclease [Carnobacterium gallinarum]|uniref:HNH endonuclease signature motif containing protein n=1 Tax=Carnobacterium gallinarum TaxID=2749 RepID=UPI00146FD94E|nr:HNH endonuclease [Carnobacterium gallinarum]